MGVLVGTDENFEKEVLKADKKVLVDFYADWCGPCKMQAPICEEISNENNDIKVVKVNIDENPELATKYEVQSIPTLLIFADGKITKGFVGVTPKEEILKEFEK